MKPIRIGTVELSNGEKLGYRMREGGERALVLIHGNMTSSAHWDLVLERIDERFKVYAVDLRGFGLSTYRRPVESLRDFAADVKEWIDALGLNRYSVMGWSMGGGVAMHLAADRPEQVEKLILLASVSTRGYSFYETDDKGQPTGRRLRTKEEIAADPGKTLPILRALKRRDKEFLRKLWETLIYTHRRPDPDRYEAYLEDMLTQRNLAEVYHALNTFNISDRHNGLVGGTGEAKRIVAPTLVLWGDRDRVVPERMALEIVEDIGPGARPVGLTDCGHSPLVDDPDQLLDRVTQFLDE
ncbi:MAG: alpha/beta hydrolase [Thermoactinomycetaceae bacterium]|nr:alpha/beta hydrolase [Thermoactinomycetaceae bacterium]